MRAHPALVGYALRSFATRAHLAWLGHALRLSAIHAHLVWLGHALRSSAIRATHARTASVPWLASAIKRVAHLGSSRTARSHGRAVLRQLPHSELPGLSVPV